MGGRKVLFVEPKEGTAYATLRKMALAVYGDACEWCGESESPLQFDHKYGDGGLDRQRNRPNTMIRNIAIAGKRLPSPALQLLCGPCHRSKGTIEAAHRAMRSRGIEVETPSRAVSARAVRADAKAIIACVIGYARG